MKMAKPIIVLTIICLITSAALAMTNAKTKDTIAKVNKQTIKDAQAMVLPKGTKGQAIQGVAKSFGGDLTVMVGVDEKGAITGVTVTNHADTPGLGTKAHDPSYLKMYIGKTAKDLNNLKENNIKDNKSLDTITGATISSNGVYHAIQKAMSKGGK